MSTDDSVKIAKSYGCKIRQFRTNNNMDESTMSILRNECWKSSINKWVIMADMDEWICVNEQDLINENNQGTTILTIKGYDMKGNSNDVNLNDINLHHIHHGFPHEGLNKSLCFKVGPIRDMNFSYGCHVCHPTGNVKFSDKTYILKHMDNLGLPYKLDKQQKRFERSEMARNKGFNIHYATPKESLIAENDNLEKTKIDIMELIKNYII